MYLAYNSIHAQICLALCDNVIEVRGPHVLHSTWWNHGSVGHYWPPWSDCIVGDPLLYMKIQMKNGRHKYVANVLMSSVLLWLKIKHQYQPIFCHVTLTKQFYPFVFKTVIIYFSEFLLMLYFLNSPVISIFL